jgi:hypothetical protein
MIMDGHKHPLRRGGGARLLPLLLIAACGGGRTSAVGPPVVNDPPPDGGAGGSGSPPGAADGGADQGPPAPPPDPLACPDILSSDAIRTYAADISPDEWAKIILEFHDIADLQIDNSFATYHPIVFHADNETITDAKIKLHGQWSWLQAATLDGDRAKMQFTVSFNEVNPNATFHGLSKLVFDMPRSDWTFLHERLANKFLRQVGIMSRCTASARLTINGAYYGLFVAEDDAGHKMLKQFFPTNPDGDLWKGGTQPQTNKTMPNRDRQRTFWSAFDISAVAAIVDLPGSLKTWAAEALLNDADGYYNGTHNFFIYDQGAKGYVFLPTDVDSTFEWLALFDDPVFNDHPVFWWEARRPPAPAIGQHWLAVMNDPGWRRAYVDAIADHLAHWNVAEIQGWLDTWSGEIAADVATDPHAWATVDDFKKAVATARDIIAKRPAFLQSFVDCERGGAADDKDGDGVKWCEDCRDNDPAVRPGVPETCGNHVDDNCNGLIDEGCPGVPTTPAPSM